MHRAQAFLILLALPLVAQPQFSGEKALAFTAKAVSLGPRPAGSRQLTTLRHYILAELKHCHCSVREDKFDAATGGTPTPMSNIIATWSGTSGKAIVISGHYDTKLFPGRNFVGANDGGASTGFLLELARILPGMKHRDEIILVWFDGEEAVKEWSATDGTYGSRHLAEAWEASGMLPRIRALINIDMIGDRALNILPETNSNAGLRALAARIASDLGYADNFLPYGAPIEDDHIPFALRNVPVLDLIDFDYGPNNQWWHTDDDTMDKLSAHSLEVAGRVVVELLHRLSP